MPSLDSLEQVLRGSFRFSYAEPVLQIYLRDRLAEIRQAAAVTLWNHSENQHDDLLLRLLESLEAPPLDDSPPLVGFLRQVGVPDEFIEQVLDVCSRTPNHTYQVLTKRAQRMARFFASRACPPNVWLGVSVEDQRYGVPRIAHLRTIDAPVRFLSVEPLLRDVGVLDLAGIHWVIVGGESGHKARPMAPEWADNVRVQAEQQGVAFFFKQWGAWGADGVRRNKKANGRQLAGQQWSEYPVIAIAA